MEGFSDGCMHGRLHRGLCGGVHGEQRVVAKNEDFVQIRLLIAHNLIG